MEQRNEIVTNATDQRPNYYDIHRAVVSLALILNFSNKEPSKKCRWIMDNLRIGGGNIFVVVSEHFGNPGEFGLQIFWGHDIFCTGAHR